MDDVKITSDLKLKLDNVRNYDMQNFIAYFESWDGSIRSVRTPKALVKDNMLEVKFLAEDGDFVYIKAGGSDFVVTKDKLQ